MAQKTKSHQAENNKKQWLEDIFSALEISFRISLAIFKLLTWIKCLDECSFSSI